MHFILSTSVGIGRRSYFAPNTKRCPCLLYGRVVERFSGLGGFYNYHVYIRSSSNYEL